jgi:hypothetical protein
MKKLLGSVALAVLVAASLPAMAQPSTTSTGKPSSSSSTAATPRNMGAGDAMSGTTTDAKKSKKKTAAKSGDPAMSGSSRKESTLSGKRDDNMASELNRQELARIQKGG